MFLKPCRACLPQASLPTGRQDGITVEKIKEKKVKILVED